MDFFALPRRDLQALCKRNSVRANMTNAAMAHALTALPTIVGIEEYVKQPVVRPEPAVKTVAEEEEAPVEKQEEAPVEKQGSPLPRGRRVTAKASVKPNDPEENATREPNKLDVAVHCVGRRGARRCARPAPDLTQPVGKLAALEEPMSPTPRGHGVKEVIWLDDSEEEKEDSKPKGNDEDAPAIGVGRRCASRRAPAPVEAPANRKRAAKSKHEAGDVAMVAVPIRTTRQHKPTLKAMVAAEEKATRRAPRRGAVKKSVTPQEEQQEPQGQGIVSDADVVPTPNFDQVCDGPGDSGEPSGPQNEEQNEVVDVPKTEGKDVVTIEDEILMVETPEEEPLVINQECMDKSALQQVDDEKCLARLANQEDSPIFCLVSTPAGVDEAINFQDIEGSSVEPLCEEINDAGEEPEMVSSIQSLQAPPTVIAEESTMKNVTGDANHESGIGDLNEVMVQEQMVTTDKVPELTRIVGDIVEDKAVVTTEEVPHSTGTMDEYVEEGQLIVDLVHADEQKKVSADGNVTHMRQTKDCIVQKDNALTNDLPQQLGLDAATRDHITSALLDGSESLSKSIITLEPTESVSEDTLVCKNGSENTEPVAMLDEKGVNVSKKSVDLTKLSLGQLRAKLKKKLNARKNNEAKRVALARVDENVCRSNAKGQQQQNLNLQH